MSYDVIVIGAGPAGSVCARHLARRGRSVLLLDKAQFPRPKICGDCLTPSCWDLWQEEDLLDAFQTLPHYSISRFLLSGGLHGPVPIPLDKEEKEHRAISRTLMDDWLIREAYQAGVDVRQSIRVQQINGSFSVSTDQGDFEGKILIGADGRNSWVARSLGITPGKALCRRVAWQARGPASDVEEGVHMKFFDHGYIGTVRHHDTESNICIVINQPGRFTPQEIAARYLGIHSSLAWKSVTPLSRQPGIVAKGNALLIGDAARIIEPFTGEGTYMAMRSGQLAALCVDKALRDHTLHSLASRYTEEHKALYRQMPFHNRLTRWLALHPVLAQRVVDVLKAQPALLELLVYSNLYRSEKQ